MLVVLIISPQLGNGVPEVRLFCALEPWKICYEILFFIPIPNSKEDTVKLFIAKSVNQ